jgi:hypothetical protein
MAATLQNHERSLNNFGKIQLFQSRMTHERSYNISNGIIMEPSRLSVAHFE